MVREVRNYGDPIFVLNRIQIVVLIKFNNDNMYFNNHGPKSLTVYSHASTKDNEYTNIYALGSSFFFKKENIRTLISEKKYIYSISYGLENYIKSLIIYKN